MAPKSVSACVCVSVTRVYWYMVDSSPALLEDEETNRLFFLFLFFFLFYFKKMNFDVTESDQRLFSYIKRL